MLIFNTSKRLTPDHKVIQNAKRRKHVHTVDVQDTSLENLVVIFDTLLELVPTWESTFTKLRLEDVTLYRPCEQGLLNVIQKCPNLRTLEFKRVIMSHEPIVAAIAHCPNLRCLALDCRDRNWEFFMHLEDALSTCYSMRHLSLTFCRMNPPACLVFAACLKHFPNLESLAMPLNRMTSKSAMFILKALEPCPRMTNLNFGHNDLDLSVSKHLNAFLQSHPNIRKLDIGSNERLDKLVLHPCKQLATLDVQGTARTNFRLFAKVLPHFESLETLVIGPINLEGVAAMAAVLPRMAQLRSLSILRTVIDVETATALVDAIWHAPNLVEF